MMVKNEDIFVKTAITNILPFVSEIIVFDTGSTDRTIDEIKSIKSKKIKLFVKRDHNPERLTEYRNEMIRMTKTPWFIIVDGDEVYSKRTLEKIVKKLKEIRGAVFRVKLWRIDFADIGLIAGKAYVGRIFRTEKIRFEGAYPFEKPSIIEADSKGIEKFSVEFPKELYLFHFRDLKRSSNQDKMIRYWRNPAFPIYFYFGDYPEGIKFSKNFLLIFIKWLWLNAFGFCFFFYRIYKKLGSKI